MAVGEARGYPSTRGVWVLSIPFGYLKPEDFGKVIMEFIVEERSEAPNLLETR